jgi:hypothetical protein
VERTARHELIPRRREQRPGEGWVLADGPSARLDWASAAYSDRTLVTKTGALHADHARPGARPQGSPHRHRRSPA